MQLTGGPGSRTFFRRVGSDLQNAQWHRLIIRRTPPTGQFGPEPNASDAQPTAAQSASPHHRIG